MKNILFFIFASFVLLNTACQPENCCEPPHGNFFIIAFKDNVQWTGYPGDNTLHGDTLIITGIGINPGTVRDTLGIRVKYTGPGDYKLLKSQVSYHSSAGYNAPLNSYKLDSLANNTLTIGGYDPVTNTIHGSFSVTFIDPNAAAGQPGDISFLDAQFYLALHK